MQNKKITIGLFFSLLIASNELAVAQKAINSSQNSLTSIDRQMRDDARKIPDGRSFEYTLINRILPYWETTVDAAGLHTLLNQNQKAYTLFKPDFDKWRSII